MDIKQIKYFLAVAEAGGFSKAAQQIHVAQPALSSHVARLEEALGVQLFVRSPKGIELTHAGDMLVDHAHDSCHGFDPALVVAGACPYAPYPFASGRRTFGLAARVVIGWSNRPVFSQRTP